MTHMKRSKFLRYLLITIITFAIITGFTLPHETLRYYQIFLLWVVMPILAWLWIEAYIEAMNGK